jgi:hypothetical protein
MATTTNNGWTIPVSSDLVRNGATAINTLGSAIDSALGKLTYTNISPTSTGTGWVLGTGNTRTANWAQTGKTVFFDGQITLGTSCVAGSAPFSVDLPIDASTNTTEFLGGGVFTDDSTGNVFPCLVRIVGTELRFYVQTIAGSPTNYLKALTFDNTNTPVTVAVGDSFTWTISYQGV